MNSNENLAMSIYDTVVKDLCKKNSEFDTFNDALDAEVKDNVFWLAHPINGKVYKLMNSDGYSYGKLKQEIQNEIQGYYGEDIRLKIRYRNEEPQQVNKTESKSEVLESIEKQDDFIGKKFGHLTVVEFDHTGESGAQYYKFRCDCGNEIIRTKTNIESRYKKYKAVSCGSACPYCIRPIKRKINETGNIYGKLTVLSKSRYNSGCTQWLCKCECGSKVWVNGTKLRNGEKDSCGHCDQTVNHNNFIDQKFGHLTVIKIDHTGSRGAIYYKCKCDCGNEIIASNYELVTSHKQSCGCYGKEYRNIPEFPKAKKRNEQTEIGKKITDWINRHNFSVSSFAHLCGCSHTLINKIRYNKDYKTSKDTLDKIANVMNCSLEELVENTEYEYLVSGKSRKPAPKLQQTLAVEKQNKPDNKPKDSFAEFVCPACSVVFNLSVKHCEQWTPYTPAYCPHCGNPTLTDDQQREIERLVKYGMTRKNARECVMEAS